MKRNKKLTKEERKRFVEKAKKIFEDPNAKWVTLEEFLAQVEKLEKEE